MTNSTAVQRQRIRRNVRTYFNKLTRAEQRAAKNFYSDTWNWCVQYARFLNVTPQTLAGVAAIMSPITVWENAKRNASHFILIYNNLDVTNRQTVEKYRPYINHTDVFIQKAIRFMETGNVGTSPKISAFYANICQAGGISQPNVITIDRHIMKALVNENVLVPSRDDRRLITTVISNEAARLHLTPQELQAVIWYSRCKKS